MSSDNLHWTFHLEVLTGALSDLEAVCTAPPASSEFKFLRSEAPDILAEAREALLALKTQMRAIEGSAQAPTIPETQH
jgi:hypothetical protein